MKGFLNFCQAGNVFKGDMSEPDGRDKCRPPGIGLAGIFHLADFSV